MPWDGTRLVVRDLATGTDVYVAGGEHEAITEPTWQADGSLWFLSDRTGWFGIYRWDSAEHATTALVEIDADIGLPHWLLGTSRYVVLSDGRVVFAQIGRAHVSIPATNAFLVCRLLPENKQMTRTIH